MSPFERVLFVAFIVFAADALWHLYANIFIFVRNVHDDRESIRWFEPVLLTPLANGLVVFFILNAVVMYFVLAPWPDMAHVVLSLVILAFTLAVSLLVMAALTINFFRFPFVHPVVGWSIFIVLQYLLIKGGEFLVT